MWKLSRIRRSLALGFAAAAICADPASVAEDMPFVERIALCDTCHGADGNSLRPNIPSLAGQPEFVILDQLIYMREGVRPVEAMAPFVRGLGDEEIVALAKHFSALVPRPSDEPVDPALVARGAKLAERLRCHSCHGTALAGHEQIPRLAKQRIDYMYQAMKAMRDNEHTSADTLMSAAIFSVSDADLLALAHYAASR